MAEKFAVTGYDKEDRKVFDVIVKAVNSTVGKLYATAHLQRTRRCDVCGQGRGVRELRLVRAVLWSGTLVWLIYRTCQLVLSAPFCTILSNILSPKHERQHQQTRRPCDHHSQEEPLIGFHWQRLGPQIFPISYI
jgi:hypothetical protein